MNTRNLVKVPCLLFVMVFVSFVSDLRAQFGYGLTLTNDMYQVYTNPEDNTNLGRSSGNVLTNLALGPKIWIGNPKIAVSLEAQAGIGFFGYDTKNNKGLGLANFPILAQINFNGVSTFNSELKPGFSLGAGMQYNRTELYGIREKYAAILPERSFFPTYIVQAGGGYGISGFNVSGYVRYGFHPETKASSLNIGLQLDMNYFSYRKNFTNPNSAL